MGTVLPQEHLDRDALRMSGTRGEGCLQAACLSSLIPLLEEKEKQQTFGEKKFQYLAERIKTPK